MKSVKQIVAAVLWCVVSVGCVAEQPTPIASPAPENVTQISEKKYPPYPDIWEWDMSMYGMEAYGPRIVPDGDIALINTMWRRVIDGKEQTQLKALHLFSGVVKEFNGYSHDYGYKSIDSRSYLKTSEGKEFFSKQRAGYLTYNGLNEYTYLKDKDGKILKEGMFIYILPKPRTYTFPLLSEVAGTPEGAPFEEKLVSIYFDYIEVPGFGLLALQSREAEFVIRFDKELNTKAPMFGKTLFWVSRSEIEMLLEKSPVKELYAAAYLQQALYDYLMKKSK